MTSRLPRGRPHAAGRPRDPGVDTVILDAAREILRTKGFDSLSFEALAKMTGVTRPTIYRRWRSKAHLASEIASSLEIDVPDVIESGGLREQIKACAEEMYWQFASPDRGAASAGLLKAAFHTDHELREEVATREQKSREQLRLIIGRGKRLGLIEEHADADLVFDALVGIILYRMMYSFLKPAATIVDDVTDLVVRGIQTRSLPKK